MKPIIWVIAVVVLQAIVAALAKRAQANQEAARAAKNAGSAAGPSATPTPAAPPIARKKPFAKFPPPKRPAAPAAKSAPRVAPPRVATRGDSDSDSAMQSRQHLADSVARLRAAEAKIRNAGVNPKKATTADPSAPKPSTPKPSIAGFASFSLSKALRNPARVREAFIMGEVLGRPKSDRP